MFGPACRSLEQGLLIVPKQHVGNHAHLRPLGAAETANDYPDQETNYASDPAHPVSGPAEGGVQDAVVEYVSRDVESGDLPPAVLSLTSVAVQSAGQVDSKSVPPQLEVLFHDRPTRWPC